MGAGVHAFKEGMEAVEKDIRENYENVTRIDVMDIDPALYGRTNAAGIVQFEDRDSMGFDVEISSDSSFSSMSHKGRVQNSVILWEINK